MSVKGAKKCTCPGRSDKIFCPRCSDLRMLILLKNGNDNLKYRRPNGQLSNPVWYSRLKYNGRDAYKVADKMVESVKKDPKYAGAVQVLMFYINGNRHQHIKKVIL
ncbi:hypothetical protein JM79_2741 [Gramella sp. Hel_I_59]|uniref:hypothetical protein n=1 Tax=Gramella sp. Hel_I_59 TaxID=1249978 RepID=UPI001154C7EC|nr:hypothetical protein [Gramella sp. Hel_I_59]TQI71792.1 hypothetical protein JM79_2741 [Gramella sp. Hel_I_59]